MTKFYSKKLLNDKFLIENPNLERSMCFKIEDRSDSSFCMYRGNILVLGKDIIKIFDKLKIKVISSGHGACTRMSIEGNDDFPDSTDDYFLHGKYNHCYFYHYIDYKVYDEENGNWGLGYKDNEYFLEFENKKDLANFKLMM